MMQPKVISGAVVIAISSAPSMAAITTSRPVRTCPSVWIVTRFLKPLSTKVWCVSASPISQGKPQCLIEPHLAAPVPPDMPEIVKWSALPLTTPEAITPMPMRATNFTEIRAVGLAFFKSLISCATSSMEYMSWCGGGEMSPTPGVAFRVSAILPITLCPGNSPPSPGFAPCANLICSSSALARYSAVTPKRPEATCLILDRKESPAAMSHVVPPASNGPASSWANLMGSSPPSPVLLLPPTRFIAIAIARWASSEIDPNEAAPVQKRFTISTAGSTSDSDTASHSSVRKSSWPLISDCSVSLFCQAEKSL
mmetsp:Transcript_57260/g.105829  ORF Transcript_57260/g.105829 Transcript_57260/m.105829 type:complete len:311 (-) Transcript_57260:324-1256(-)